MILATIAAAGGFLMAYWCRNLFVLLLPARDGQRMNLPGDMDWRVLALSTGACLIATLLFGLVPAMQTSKIDLTSALKAEAGGVVGGGRLRGLVRSGLVLVQVALSFVLLVGAGLLLQSLRGIQNISPGFSTRTLTPNVDVKVAGYDRQRTNHFQDA